MANLCLRNEAYTVCSAFVPSRGLCPIFAYRTRHTQCAARLNVPSRGSRQIFAYRTRHTQCVVRLNVP